MDNNTKRPSGQNGRGFSTGQRAGKVGVDGISSDTGAGRPAPSPERRNVQRPAGQRPVSAQRTGVPNRNPQSSQRPRNPQRPQRPQQVQNRQRPSQGRPVRNNRPENNKNGFGDILQIINVDFLKKNIVYIGGALLIFCIIIFILCVHKENPLKLKGSESPIYISEYMSKNTHYFNEKMDTPDWVEIYNPSDKEIDLSTYSLSNGKKKIKLKGTIGKKEYKVIYLSSSAFTLDHDIEGEVFYLKEGKSLVDMVTSQKISKNDSISRIKDKDGNISEKKLKKSTPGFSNNAKGLEKYLKSRTIKNETGIVFNEVMASNKNTYTDEFGDTVDYIELLNKGEKTVDLSGYGLSDSGCDPFAFKFPKGTKLKSGEIVLINCSSDYETKDEAGVKSVKESRTGAIFACFGLKKGKESVYLSNPDAKIIEKLSLDRASSDQSIIRTAQGTYIPSFYISPGYPNDDEGVAEYNATVKSTTDMNGIYISEAMSKNTAYAPFNGAYYDWVELYNPTSSDINLNGYTLSDSAKKPGKYTFSNQVIKAKSYLVVYCTDKNISGLNTGFDLNGGCACYLFGPDKKMLDKINLGELVTNVSKGRSEGSADFKYFEKPTPGSANKGGKAAILSAPVASIPSGQYNDKDVLEVGFSAGGTIYYTTDGSKPTTSSKKYTSPLRLSKTTVVRTMAVSSDATKSSIATYSYIINENHKMDVVMVSADPDGLFSYSNGIYAKGPGASASFPYLGANFWKDWKRQANVTFIPQSDKEEGFSIDGETSIFGGYSRGYDKKSLKFKFKDVYGQGKLNYNLFENRDFTEYDSFVLRPCGQDVYGAVMRDDLITTMSDSLVDVMASRPAVLYINGEYYGIYYIREKINAQFVASRLNVSESSVDLLQNTNDVNAGSRNDWLALMSYLDTHNLADDSAYKYVTDRVDVKNLADYVIAEMYCGNTDGGNIRWYKSREADNKWRWIMYDTDYGMTKNPDYSFYRLISLNSDIRYEMFPRKLLNALFKNKAFRNLFVQRLEYQMNFIWNSDHVISMIDEFAARIADEIPRNHKRWNVTSDWNANVERMRTFAKERQTQLKNEFASSAGLRGIIALTNEELDKCFEN